MRSPLQQDERIPTSVMIAGPDEYGAAIVADAQRPVSVFLRIRSFVRRFSRENQLSIIRPSRLQWIPPIMDEWP